MESDPRPAQPQSSFFSITKGHGALRPLGAAAPCPHPEPHPCQQVLPASASSPFFVLGKMNYFCHSSQNEAARSLLTPPLTPPDHTQGL